MCAAPNSLFFRRLISISFSFNISGDPVNPISTRGNYLIVWINISQPPLFCESGMTTMVITKRYRIPTKKQSLFNKLKNNEKLPHHLELLKHKLEQRVVESKKKRQKYMAMQKFTQNKPLRHLVMMLRLSHGELVYDLEDGEILE